MKAQIFLLALLFVSLQALGQSKFDYYNDLGEKVNDDSGEKRLEHVLRNEFSKIISANTPGIIGNYVGISTKDNTLSFAYSFIKKNRVFQLNAGGGITDGVMNLISNSELNTGVSLGFKYSWISGQSKIEIDYDPIEKIRKKDKELGLALKMFESVSNIEREKKLKADSIKKEAKVSSLKARIDTLRKRLGQNDNSSSILYIDQKLYYKHSLRKPVLESELSLLKTKVKDSSDIVQNRLARLRVVRDNNLKKDSYAAQRFKIDSLKALEIPRILLDSLNSKNKQLKALNTAIQNNTANLANLAQSIRELTKAKIDLKDFKIEKQYFDERWEENDTYDRLEADRRKNLDKFAKARARSLSLSWFTVGGNLSNQSFKRFDPLLGLDDQIFGDNDLIPSLEIAYTKYDNRVDPEKTNNKRSISFLNFAARIRYGNNLNSLQLLTIETSDPLSANKAAVSSLKAYQGEFEDNILTTQFSADYYSFLGSNDDIGFHLKAQFNTQPGLEITSLRGGLVFAVKSAKDGKSIINFELFAGLNDIFKEGEEDSLLSRNVLGIQTTIPFNFKF